MHQIGIYQLETGGKEPTCCDQQRLADYSIDTSPVQRVALYPEYVPREVYLLMHMHNALG